jgi:hypothetical protein
VNEEPAFLSVDQVRDMHRAALEAFGGHDGLRAPGLFDGAVFHPQIEILQIHFLNTPIFP